MEWDCGAAVLRPLTGSHCQYHWRYTSEYGGIILTGEKRRAGRETCPGANVTPRMPKGLNWKRRNASVVRIPRLETACVCYGLIIALVKCDINRTGKLIRWHQMSLLTSCLGRWCQANKLQRATLFAVGFLSWHSCQLKLALSRTHHR